MTKQKVTADTQAYVLRKDALDIVGVRQSMFQMLCNTLHIGSVHFDGVGGWWYAREDLEIIQTYKQQPWRKEELLAQVKHPLSAGREEQKSEVPV